VVVGYPSDEADAVCATVPFARTLATGSKGPIPGLVSRQTTDYRDAPGRRPADCGGSWPHLTVNHPSALHGPWPEAVLQAFTSHRTLPLSSAVAGVTSHVPVPPLHPAAAAVNHSPIRSWVPFTTHR
jgi:hypothetical protein